MEYFTLSDNTKIPVIGFGPGSMGYVPNKRPEKKKIYFCARIINLSDEG